MFEIAFDLFNYSLLFIPNSDSVSADDISIFFIDKFGHRGFYNVSVRKIDHDYPVSYIIDILDNSHRNIVPTNIGYLFV